MLELICFLLGILVAAFLPAAVDEFIVLNVTKVFFAIKSFIK